MNPLLRLLPFGDLLLVAGAIVALELLGFSIVGPTLDWLTHALADSLSFW